jgi:hypothetical protein
VLLTNLSLNIEYYLGLLTIGALLASGVLGFVDEAIERALSNTDDLGTSQNVGEWFEKKVGANATDYQDFDHIVDEGGKKHVISIATRDSDNPKDIYDRIQDKVNALKEDKDLVSRPDKNAPTISRATVGSKSVLLAVPETKATVLNDRWLVSALRELQKATKVRIFVTAITRWRGAK